MSDFITTHRTEIGASGTEYIYLENTGSQQIIVEKIKTATEGQLEISIYKGTGQDTAGTSLTLVDKNETDDNIDVKAEHGGTYTTNTSILDFFVPGGSTGTRQGDSEEEGKLVTISPGENYLFELDELSGTATDISFSGHLSER